MTSIKMNEDKELARRSDSTVVNIDNNHDNSNQRCQETENPELVMLVTGKEIPRDGSDPERAIHTLPDGFLCVNIRNTLGIFTGEFLPNGVSFGPYEGMFVYNLEVDPSSKQWNERHCWKIYNEDGVLSYCIDAEDESMANWLRYVRSSTDPDQHNMRSVIHDGHIYYTTIKDIIQGTELILNTETVMVYIPTDPKVRPMELADQKSLGKVSVLFPKMESLNTTISSDGQTSVHRPMTHQSFPTTSTYITCEDIKGDDASEGVPVEDNPGLSSYEDALLYPPFAELPPAPSNDMNTKKDVVNVCQESSITDVKESELSSVVFSHVAIKLFTCDRCERTYERRNSLKRHQRDTHEKGEVLSFACVYCSKSFRTKKELSMHNRVHPDKALTLFTNPTDGDNTYYACSVRKYGCDICQKMFTTKSSVVRHHKIMHTEETSVICNICQKVFLYKINLKTHMQNVHRLSIL